MISAPPATTAPHAPSASPAPVVPRPMAMAQMFAVDTPEVPEVLVPVRPRCYRRSWSVLPGGHVDLPWKIKIKI